MNEELLWERIRSEVDTLFSSENLDQEAIEDLIYLLLLKRMYNKDNDRFKSINECESNVLSQIERIMRKDKDSFESVLGDLNKIFN
ncbi:hypothetical protein [Paraliobacillus salinarum]|uniref:hypothetical protein n=1 Tax=Paraliobacillus salinarum TaxID=1158996 RepID=UPI0015F372F5|nr:hypothetical protein [Paraliobacillus salinarum]